MNSSSLALPARSFGARPSDPTPAGATRRQRTFTVVDLIRDATLSLVQRFLGSHDSRGHKLARTVEAASAEVHGEGGGNEKERLRAARQHLTDLVTVYENYLSQSRLRQWRKDDPEARAVRTVGQRAAVGQIGYRAPAGVETYRGWLEQPDASVVANTILCLIHQANYMLDRQIRLLDQGFRPEPGTSPGSGPAGAESPAPAEPVPACPVCNLPMIARTARREIGRAHV